MLLEQINGIVAHIDSISHDNENAHAEEDALIVTFIKAVANGFYTDPEYLKICATAVLTVNDLKYERWYA